MSREKDRELIRDKKRPLSDGSLSHMFLLFRVRVVSQKENKEEAGKEEDEEENDDLAALLEIR